MIKQFDIFEVFVVEIESEQNNFQQKFAVRRPDSN